MRAMILPALCRLDENPNPLQLAVMPDPMPGPGEILVRVSTCGVCHTEWDKSRAGHPRRSCRSSSATKSSGG